MANAVNRVDGEERRAKLLTAKQRAAVTAAANAASAFLGGDRHERERALALYRDADAVTSRVKRVAS